MTLPIGSTPKNEFILPYETEIADLLISYTQNDIVLLRKRKADCDIKGNVVTVTLSQEETFSFDDNKIIVIQLAIKYIDGTVDRSKPIYVTPEKCFDKEVV